MRLKGTRANHRRPPGLSGYAGVGSNPSAQQEEGDVGRSSDPLSRSQKVFSCVASIGCAMANIRGIWHQLAVVIGSKRSYSFLTTA